MAAMKTELTVNIPIAVLNSRPPTASTNRTSLEHLSAKMWARRRDFSTDWLSGTERVVCTQHKRFLVTTSYWPNTRLSIALFLIRRILSSSFSAIFSFDRFPNGFSTDSTDPTTVHPDVGLVLLAEPPFSLCFLFMTEVTARTASTPLMQTRALMTSHRLRLISVATRSLLVQGGGVNKQRYRLVR